MKVPFGAIAESDSTHVCAQTGCVRLAMVNRAEAKAYRVDERMMNDLVIRSCFKNGVCLKRMSLMRISRACEKGKDGCKRNLSSRGLSLSRR